MNRPENGISQPIVRILLLGFMGSGKSSVGRALARRLDWDFVDLDAEIERREGRTVAMLVEESGEEYLRRAEAALTDELHDREALVLAPGGGWITQPFLLAKVHDGGLAVWLRVSPREILRRMRTAPKPHPLGSGAEALDAIVAAMRDREPLYRLADLSIPTDGRPIEEIAFEIEQVVRTRGMGRGV